MPEGDPTIRPNGAPLPEEPSAFIRELVNDRSSREISPAEIDRMKTLGVFLRRNDSPDKFMLRLRIPGCELTAEQAREIAFVSYEFGHGIVDITRRAGLQIQGVDLAHVPLAIDRLSAKGLSCKQTGKSTIRNIYGHPFSGRSPEELYDTRSLCRDIETALLVSSDASPLPHKLNIALNGMPHHASSYWIQDIAFLATQSNGEPQFQVLVGGRQGEEPKLASHLPVLLRPEQVVPVTVALRRLFEQEGAHATKRKVRFDFVVKRLGIGGILEFLSRELEFDLIPGLIEPTVPVSYDDLIGWFPEQATGRWSMGLAVPVGRLTWQQLEGLAVASGRWGEGILRTTPEQGIILCGISTGFKDSCATEAARVGLSPYADSLVRNIFACTGKQFCNLGVTDTKGPALKLIDQLRQKTLALHGIRIHLSGCSSGCMQHLAADIGLKGVRIRRLFGSREGFDVFLGGGIAGKVHLGLPYRLGVDINQLPQLIEEVVREYYLRHKPGYTFSAYWREVLHHQQATQVGAKEYVPPLWICDCCQHRHWGDDPPVYCPKCAALRRYFARVDPDQLGENGSGGTAESLAIVELPSDWDETVPSVSSSCSKPPVKENEIPLAPLKKATVSLIQLLEQITQSASKSQESNKPRGRPRDPKIAKRDSLIRRIIKERPNLGHSEIARLVQEATGEEVTQHMVRNAIKRLKRR